MITVFESKLIRGTDYIDMYDQYDLWLSTRLCGQVVCTSICETSGSFGDKTTVFMIVTYKVNKLESEKK